MLNYYEDYLEIEINFIPKDNYNKSRIFFDLVIFYKIDNTKIIYNGKIFYNEKELEKFFKWFK